MLNAALEARRPSCPPRLEHPISLPPLPSAPAWGPGEGSGGKGRRRRRFRGVRAAWGEARAASCSPAAAFASSPGAAAPGRPHYAGGLPAAAMARRAVVRAGHSPQRFLVRAAFPLSRSYPLPFRSNSSSTSFPRPLFLLLLLILLLLLEDAGAQQGEFFPRSAVRAGPRGPWGRRGSLWGAGCPGRYGICRRAG